MTQLDQQRELRQRTRAHYDAFPLEFLSSEKVQDIEAAQPRPFLEFCRDHLREGMRVLDAGCGPGRALPYLASLGAQVTGCDLSGASLRLARERAPKSALLQSDVLHLPFAESSFDAVSSDGVLHHSPDAKAGLTELARVTRPHGHIYIAVYKQGGRYSLFYRFPGALIRWLDRAPGGKALVSSLFLPPYYLVHRLKSGGSRGWSGARNFFYDYFVSPRVTFHSREEVEVWGRESGLELVKYHPYEGSNVHVFIFRKSEQGLA